MGWETVYRYKLQGMRINYQGEALYLFDLSAKEAFLPQKRDPKTGKIKTSRPILPPEWLSSFGMDVKEHAASTQIDLSDGFLSGADANEGNGNGHLDPSHETSGIKNETDKRGHSGEPDPSIGGLRSVEAPVAVSYARTAGSLAREGMEVFQ